MTAVLAVAVEAPRPSTIIVELGVVISDITWMVEGTAEHSPVSLLTGCNTAAAPLGVSSEL